VALFKLHAVVQSGTAELRLADASTVVPVLTTAVDDDTKSGNAVYPEAAYLILSAVAILAGAVLGTLAHDNWGAGIHFKPPEGAGIFALFYIIAQGIERIQEPFTPFVTAKETGGNGRKTQRRAKAELESSVASAEAATTLDEAATVAKTVANNKRTVDQVRANLTALLFGSSALLAMLLSGYLKAGLLRTIGVSGVPVWIDVVVTGIVVGAGTKPLHDLISNLTESKEKKQDPEGTD
jgi:hypothetical protein